ncbi:hypothetical protein FQR65_LT04392 [Abscondita terminalis]|nr:hypothetical protein FQR65_LT04392 [Abscondita terminalis]
MIKVEVDIDYMMLLAMILAFISIIVLLTWDVLYFARTILVVIWGRIFETSKNSDQETFIYGMCTTNDLDILFKHMNNAKYARELDFARIHFYDRTGIYNAIVKGRGTVFQTALIIKFRRTIPLFSTYKIVTKIMHWDEKSIYLEQRFISLSDNFVKAISYSKQAVVGVNAAEIVTSRMDKDVSYKFEITDEIKHFINFLDSSSATLRKKDD